MEMLSQIFLMIRDMVTILFRPTPKKIKKEVKAIIEPPKKEENIIQEPVKEIAPVVEEETDKSVFLPDVPVVDNKVIINKHELLSLGISPKLVDKYIEPLQSASKKYNIDNSLKLSHFFAQILHESGMLKYSEEIADGSAYEGRSDLGNTNPGDGVKYKGRGAIQITGRSNYGKYSKYTGIDFIADPTKILEPSYVIDSAAWFWSVFKKDRDGNSLNDMADNDLFFRITYFVNGGINGIDHRLSLLKRCYMVFKVPHVQDKLNAHKKYLTGLLNKTNPTTLEKLLKSKYNSVEIINKSLE